MSSSNHQRTQTRPGGCVGFFALPFYYAIRIFRPSRSDRVVDAGVNLAQRARTAVGLAATAWLLYAYPLHESAAHYAQNQILGALQATGVLIIAGPLALAVFVIAARSPGRALYWRRLAGPLAAFSSLFGAVLLAWYLIMDSGARTLALHLGWFAGFADLAGLLVGFGALAFAGTGAVIAVHHVFRTADVHEVLPPLISPVLVWAMMVLQLLQTSDVTAPQWIQLLFLIGPPLSVTALAAFELRRLRTRWGITIGSALHRVPVQPAR
ncbi:hypothetical protein [Streptacidiphilus sp. EB103A]|uniref:hypothetical protein n=1 Tax=Streptacidiphilus sp. EB103A TaxID=3156275 RepID=UPI0035183480